MCVYHNGAVFEVVIAFFYEANKDKRDYMWLVQDSSESSSAFFFVKLESNNAIPKTLEVPWDLKSLHLQILSQNSIRFAKNQCMNDYKISIKVCMMHKVITKHGFQRKSHFCCRFLDQKY